MINFIKNWVKERTFYNISIVLFENILSKGLNFILVILLARTLGPEKYGIYSFITVSILFISIFFDFAMENSAVRFSGKYQNKREEIFGIYILFKTGMLMIFFLLFFLFPDAIGVLLNKPIIRKYLLIIFLGGMIESYQYIITTYLQSCEKFLLRAIINTGVFFIRLSSIILLLSLSEFDIRIISLFFALSGAPFLFVFSKYFINFLRKLILNKISIGLFKEIFHYGKWLVLGAIAMNIMTRIDFYLVTYFFSFREMGLYNTAVQLTSPVALFSLVFGKVLLPKVSKYSTLNQIKSYLKKVIRLGITILASGILIIPFSKLIILFIFGDKYAEAGGVFTILLISSLFTLCNVMLGIAFYSLGHSKLMAIGAYVKLFIFLGCSLFLIPALGMEGAALSKMIGTIAYLCITILFLLRLIYGKGPKITSIYRGK